MKSNIEIIKDYLAGVRPISIFGYTGEVNKHRKEGERWIDSNGVEWERKGERNVCLTKTQGDLIRELTAQKCPKCRQDIRWGTKLDRKFFFRTGLCENCLVDYETKLHIVGIYHDYEMYKLLSYQLGYLKDMREKLKEIVKYFTENAGDVEMICNSEGFTERWKNTNQEKILRGAKNDLKLAHRRIVEITKAIKEAKKKYIEGTSKYKLETYV
jgi:hypothetical protein